MEACFFCGSLSIHLDCTLLITFFICHECGEMRVPSAPNLIEVD